MICGGFGFSFNFKTFDFMCKILFSESGPMVCIAKDLNVEDAIQFALNLHRSSNVKHSIFVNYDDKPECPVLILESK